MISDGHRLSQFRIRVVRSQVSSHGGLGRGQQDLCSGRPQQQPRHQPRPGSQLQRGPDMVDINFSLTITAFEQWL